MSGNHDKAAWLKLFGKTKLLPINNLLARREVKVASTRGGRIGGKVAIVTGAGSAVPDVMGNGKASAILYAREGARVMLVDCNLEAVEETKTWFFSKKCSYPQEE